MEKKEYYAKVRHYATAYEALTGRFRKVAELFSRFEAKRILDIGCAEGNFTQVLKQVTHAEEVYGIELSEEGMKSATEKGIKCFKVDVDTENFPFKDSYFDAIHCGEVIEHLFNPDHLLDEIHRTLKPDGICVLSTRNLCWWLNRIVVPLGFQPYSTSVSLRHNVGKFKMHVSRGGGHLRVFAYRSLEQLLRIHQFTVLKTLGLSLEPPISPPLMNLIIKAIDRVLSRLFPSMAEGMIFVVRRSQ